MDETTLKPKIKNIHDRTSIMESFSPDLEKV